MALLARLAVKEWLLPVLVEERLAVGERVRVAVAGAVGSGLGEALLQLEALGVALPSLLVEAEPVLLREAEGRLRGDGEGVGERQTVCVRLPWGGEALSGGVEEGQRELLLLKVLNLLPVRVTVLEGVVEGQWLGLTVALGLREGLGEVEVLRLREGQAEEERVPLV